LLNASASHLLFLHIPKTAGTSLLTVFGNAFGEARVRRLSGSEVTGPALDHFLAAGAHREIGCLAGHFPLHPFASRRDEFTLFTLLRHPVDRVFSLFRFLRQLGEDELARLGLRRGFGFDDFLACQSAELFGQVRNGMCRLLSGEPRLTDHDDPLFWRSPLAPCYAEAALATLRRCRFGIAEEMADTAMLVRGTLGLPFVPTPTCENATDPAGAERNARNIQRVREMNRADLILYERALPLFRERVAGASAAACAVPGLIAPARLPAEVDVPIEQIGCRDGFHAFEPGNGFSWMVAGAAARMAVEPTLPVGRFRFRVWRVVPDYPMDALTLTVDGSAVPHRWQKLDEGWGVIESEPVRLGSLALLSLSAPPAVPVRSFEPESQDRRDLAVALATVAFAPP